MRTATRLGSLLGSSALVLLPVAGCGMEFDAGSIRWPGLAFWTLVFVVCLISRNPRVVNMVLFIAVVILAAVVLWVVVELNSLR